MATVEEFLCQSGHEMFREAVNLNDVESSNDPQSEPYKSKYKARELFHKIKLELDSLQQNDEVTVRHSALTAVLSLRLGMNYIECEELSSGEEHLDKCVQVLESHRLDPLCCNTLQLALNQLGILWSGRGEIEKAKTLLGKAETLYNDYKKEVGSSPMISDELFQVPDEDQGVNVKKQEDHFESTFTHTLYYLAQIYEKTGQNHKAAKYCQETLRRQLDTKQYDPVDWSINAATLSQYYMLQADFPNARHCLASACFILNETGDPPSELLVTPKDEESQNELISREKIPKAWADIYRCWVKYGLCLLEYSKGKLYEELVEEESATDQTETEDDLTYAEIKKQFVKFDLELTAVESEISDQRALDFADARAIFLPVQKWLNSAKSFYVLDGHCTDHVEIVQDHSQLYKVLAFFEPDFDRQCKMHKRRADLLQGLVDEISMQHYFMLCRQMIYELAEIYSNILDIKMSILEQSGAPPTPHATKKINQLIASSIKYYQTYLDSLRDADKKVPPKFASDDERPAIVAHFCVGRLYSKIIDFDVSAKIANLTKSIEHYQFVVDYCKRNPESEEKVKSENEICKEMVVLLPAKMDRIRSRVDIVRT